jgi:YidC/Oxa1 family membrane protein insertase
LIPQSPNIRLFNPAQQANGYFAEVGFIADAQSGPAPGPDTVWSAAPGQSSRRHSPVTLTYDNGRASVHPVISVDEHFLFQFEDTIANSGRPDRICCRLWAGDAVLPSQDRRHLCAA